MITDAMRRAVPAPCYQCAWCEKGGNDCTCYPADLIGYVPHADIWICSFCVESADGDELLGFHWDENEEPAYEHEWGVKTDKKPEEFYVCEWGDCGAESTFRPADLHWVSGWPHRDGFYCCDHVSDIRERLSSRWGVELPYPTGPTLADVLQAENMKNGR